MPVESPNTPPVAVAPPPAPGTEPEGATRLGGPPSGTVERPRSGGVTWKSVLLGLLLIPVNAFWITVVEVRWYTLDGTSLPLLITPVFILFCLTVLNFPLRRYARRLSLDQGELLTVYIMVLIASTLAGHDMIQNLFGAIGHAERFADGGNNWRGLFINLLPRWLFQFDKATLTRFYLGNSSIYSWEAVRPWLVPLFWWGVFVMTLVGMMLCINIILRRQWTENEKLSFPIVQLPLAMTEQGDPRRFWLSWPMWAGFGCAALVTLINGLHVLYPSLPWMPAVKLYDISPYFQVEPLNAIGPTNISMYPFAIGLAYFIPLDLSFSCWFFYLWRKSQQVVGRAYGLDSASNQGWPFFNEQASGAWIGLVIIILFANRTYFARVLRQVTRGVRSRRPEEAREVREYRWAIAGIIAGCVIIGAFMQAVGMALWVTALFFLLYFALSFAITRVRAELGTPHEIYFVNPQQIMGATLGSQLIGRENATYLWSFYWFNRGYRCHPMPNQLESFKMAEGGRINIYHLLWLTMLATLWGLLCAYWANLHVTYAAGATAKATGFKSWVGSESFSRLSTWLVNPVRPEVRNLSWMLAGGGMVFLLKALRGMFAWWPFHPAGYALAVSYAMDYFWFAFFLSWLAKVLIVRYGGMNLHRNAIPFFLGLVLGDYVTGSIWGIIGPALGILTYKIYI
jgi:hypothetical protein